jgi:O-antigen ligase
MSIDRIIFRVLLVCVMLAPLPFGAVYPWAWGGLAFIVGTLLAVWSLTRMVNGTADGPVPVGLNVTGPILVCFAVLLAWLILQAAPGVPLAWRHPLWREASAALGLPDEGSIGLDPGNATAALIRLATYAGVFWLALHYGRDPVRAKQAIAAVAIAGGAFALYGLAGYFAGWHSILWIDKVAYSDDLTSTFINRNNYATYAGLSWLCLLALFFRGLAKWTEERSGRNEWLHALLRFIEREGWLHLLGTLVLVSALLTSHSRGGLLATVAGIVVFCIALSATRSYERRLGRRFSTIAFILLAAVYFAGGRVVDERLAAAAATQDDRPKVYALTAKSIGDQPWLGTGLGTFEEAFRFYRTPDVTVTYAQAHNTYLENALEMGVPGCGLLSGGILCMSLSSLWGVRRRRRDGVYSCLGLGVTVLVGAHSLVDFSMQIPAVAITYALILGVSLAQSWSTRPKTNG